MLMLRYISINNKILDITPSIIMRRLHYMSSLQVSGLDDNHKSLGGMSVLFLIQVISH